jgi:SSS family solute:Na+ symporter
MAQNLWIPIMGFVVCVVVTTIVSLATTPRPDQDMEGLVYGLTEIPHDPGVRWYQRPATLAIIVLIMVILLNIWFA